MNELALFAGAGGGILGTHGLLGWRTVAAVEIEPIPRMVLLQRQADDILPRFPVWDDVRTFDGKPWRGKVDVVTGGFPCQDISAAGKGAGITGERSGLWSEFARIIGEVRPAYVLVENSPMLVSRGLDVVLSDLAALGYDAEWGIIGAHHAGAPHKRDRIWILGYATGKGLPDRWCGQMEEPGQVKESERSSYMPDVAYANSPGCEEQREPVSNGAQQSAAERNGKITWWDRDPADGPVESRLGRVSHGVAHRVDRLKAIGNGQVPAVVALAWEILSERTRRK